MSAYVVVEFTVKDPDVYREKYGPNAGRTAKEYGGEVLANANWEILHGDGSLTSGALMRFPDHETVIEVPRAFMTAEVNDGSTRGADAATAV